MKLSFEQLKSFQGNMRQVPRLLAENAFLFTLALIGLAVAVSLLAVFFSRSSLKEGSREALQSGFQETLFQDVFSKLEERKANFATPNTPNIPNIF
ncbi:MAG: hypothetical protein A2842_02360 [Candidatus Wildermuthbacteria bacterium RIFCSPHIGHO2_01_FULL_48_25]|uniref:Uncharacterized protein n=1 Tax=Candidatus Wildermuthbacteria bacterium RIFCSPLOWO2_01_FULL_48_16 TaxID=1802461 RepID=A0A1G2RK84_9BACT|nr:MAG: hypothetical protein A2842_02360 [Candidatus Wildermuthbacteria bacterium RIFCSPHIGHO2_01_FULL_48_25]OHA69318.1 MAG: hypothetical protein A3J57_00300 [Candidatus Wildermuthbacteria bacterium RIFCSPHIGHO2_02_FULL_49_12b]OHA73207.1 MAG: hypothetical protein A3B24_01085 [Candidatus Wildermuthbacteria bacterium RIFCSPLOWO2_01_FULL_48_16]